MNIKNDIENISDYSDLEKFKGKKVLLIGSSGFLGKWFAEYFSHNNIEFFRYDVCDGLDICDGIKLNIRCDFVINCAGIASPEKYMKMPIETLDVSYIGTKNVLEYCIENKVESVLLFSSSEVYGTPDKDSIPTKEEYVGSISTNGDRSCYDIGKQVLETLSNVYYKKYSVPVKIVRPFNVYGPHMGLEDNRVLSNWFRNLLNNKELVVYGNGNQTRTFCYASDAISMMIGVLLNGENGEVYNVGNPDPELTMNELSTFFKLVFNYGKIKLLNDYPEEYPSQEPLRRCPNIEKTESCTGIVPKVDLKSGLEKMYDFYKK